MTRTRLTALGAALLGAALGAGVLAACGSSGTSDANIGGDPTRAKATPGALVATALAHLDAKPGKIESFLDYYGSLPPRTIGAEVRFRATGESDGDSLELTVGPRQPVVPGCEEPSRCAQRRSDLGTVTVSWDLEEPEEDPGLVVVRLDTAKETRRIVFAGPEITRDPRTLHLRVVGGVDTMTAILEDPAFALSSTRGAVAAGKELKSWDGRDTPVPDPGPLVPWTPRALAALMSTSLPSVEGMSRSRFDEPPGPTGTGTGVRANLYGPSLNVLVVAHPTAGATTCPEGYTCRRAGHLTYAWASGGRTAVLRERQDFVVRAYLRDPSGELGKVNGPADFEHGFARALVELTAHPALGLRMSSDWTTYFPDLAWEGRG